MFNPFKNKNVFKIPNSIQKYPEGEPPKAIEVEKMVFEPVEGELVEVVMWARYPDYDFIFGVPAKESWRSEKECAFFCTRIEGKTRWTYLDQPELEDFIKGFELINEKVRATK